MCFLRRGEGLLGEGALFIRRIVFIYLGLLAIQYALNPFVPPPREGLARQPQSLPKKNPGIFAAANGALVYMDEHGLIVQADGDGGDTAQRTGMFYYVYHDPDGFARALDLLEVYPGIYVRHPFQDGFISDPRRFSRDQQRPLIITMGKYGMKDRLWRMAKGQILRLGKYQNLDYISPIGVGEYIRAFEAKPLYPILFVTDTFLFFGSLALVIEASFNPDEVDDNNHVMTLLQARDVMPTPIGRWAFLAYQHLRPKNMGNFVLGKESAVHGALAWYHREESGGNPYIGEAIYAAFAKSESSVNE